MSQVKETIDLLTRVLRGNGTSKIKAEIFRLAKFDKDEAAQPLWRLLFELLYFLEHGTIDEVVIKACNELTIEEQVVFVKQELQGKGFYSRHFSQLPNDMSSGSRELLLALAWLLCTDRVIDKFMEKCASPIDEDTYTPDVQRINLEGVSGSCEGPTTLSPVEKLQRLQLLNGKLHLSLKRLCALQRERTRLQHRVHDSTTGVSLAPDRNHLTVMEVHLLRHPEYLKKLLKLLEKDNERLQVMIAWKDHEEIFWKWMESVLELKLKQTTSEREEPMVHYNIAPGTVEAMLEARQQLEVAILKYEPVIERLEELWETKKSSIDNAELDNLLSLINMDIAVHKAIIAGHKSNAIMETSFKEPRLVYVKKTLNKKSSNIPSGAEGMGETPNIKTEIEALETNLRRLEYEGKRKDDFYRKELDSLAATVPGAICIQPTSLR